MENDIIQSLNSDDLIEKIWSRILRRQHSINRQLEEIDKKYILRIEENNRLVEESEKKLFKRMDVNNFQIKEYLKKNNFESENEEENAEGKDGKTKSKRNAKKSKSSGSSISGQFKEKGWKLYGVIAGDRFTSEEKQAIQQAGFYVYEQFGSSSNKTMIIDVPDNFTPKEL